MDEFGSVNLEALDPILAEHGQAGREQLLPVLLQAQNVYGYLSEAALTEIGRALEVPLAEIHGVLQFYTMLYDQPTGRTIIRVCTGPRCAELGSHRALERAGQALGIAPGEVTADGEYMLEEVPCLCLCDQAPAALVGDTPVGNIDVDSPQGWIHSPQEATKGIVGGDPRWLTARCGEMAPTDLAAYEARGGYQGLRRAMHEMAPGEVVGEVKASGLVGRGGAAFPTGLKWQFTKDAEGGPPIVVANGDESEPGTFKDRVLMEYDPFAVLEGMALAGYAVGARRGYLYIRGEYARAQRIVAEAIQRAHASGRLGTQILGSDYSFDVELRSGAGAYVCGEETALFESIEGKRGYPRLKPPYPTTHGLFGRPTVINNVETLCAAAWIISHGADAYRSVGTEGSPGVKMFCLSGDVRNPGVYEAPFGISVREIIDMAGGAEGEIQAVLLGGAAGAFARPEELDVELSFEAMKAARLTLGSGAVVVMNEDRDLRQTLLELARFFAHESCGKCFPCQLGTQRQLEIIEAVAAREATNGDLDALRDVGFTMTNASICGLGMTAGAAVLSALEKFPKAFT
jgi:NADH-quinone oxidoreductase subunit F